MGAVRACAIAALLVLPASAGAGEIPADPLAPILVQAQARKVVREFRQGRYSRAAVVATAALNSEKLAEQERCALRFLRALARIRAGLRPDEADLVQAIGSKSLPGLRSHAAWYLGKRLWDRGRAAGDRKAWELAGPYFERVGFPGRFGLEARSRMVRGMLACGQMEQACRLAERTATAVYRRFGEARAVLALASCRERVGWALARAGERKKAKKTLRRAAGLFRQVAVLWPDRWAGPIADKSRKRLAKAGYKPCRPDPEPLLRRARDIVERPMGLRDRRRLWRVRTLLPWNLKGPAGAEVELLWAELCMRHRRFKRSWRSAARVKRLAPSPELRARAALLLGRLTARRRSLAAVAEYLNLVKRWPGTSSAAPALYEAAEISRRYGRAQRAKKLFVHCAADYDGQPAADLCRWGLAWVAFRAGKPKKALEWLEPLCERDEIEDVDLEAFKLRERAGYWQARIHEQLGHKDQAVAGYLKVVDDLPFSYYALMAFERLCEIGHCPELAPGPASPGPTLPDALHPEVAAALVYFRMGLVREARNTLMTLRRDDLVRPVDRRWASLLRQEMGDFSRSHRLAPVPRDMGLPDYPGEGWRIDARLAYPRAFAEQVEGPARAPEVPANLLYALIRVESGFWPEARSPALARGLTQVITRTAWAMARKLKIRRFRRWRLYEPEMAVKVGSTYMATLLDRYGHPALAIAAYNAGEPSVNRWMRRRGDLPVDAFIEEIPYSETARYTKRLLSWWAIYRILYEPGVNRPLGMDFDLMD